MLIPQEHEGITFRYVASTTYEFDCEWYIELTRNHTLHENTSSAATNMNVDIAAESQKSGQWTGTRGGHKGAPTQPAEPTDTDCGTEGNEMKAIVPGSIDVSVSTSPLVTVHAALLERELIYTTLSDRT